MNKFWKPTINLDKVRFRELKSEYEDWWRWLWKGLGWEVVGEM
jgi:hypothetical protein